ncbi:MAG: NAD(P)H-hydrate dehydratase [Clostridia bacterium]|nr:NAD(P)H-hydrate dehydratase [Clostridia bacterium]MBR4439873.1 NAD(P)H-hydrate dehydratase [Clostridia bacterium]MBR5768487.1 NAD(P)H-hydrate dehydratase [Clostridia bacterium]MBR5941742.1 NAD(P)H-hydrate dehydratase [Clostridia bacterium]
MEYRVIDDEYVSRFIVQRPEAANKYDFGYVLCVCGSRGMHGAAVMAATAALRSGAGIVTVAVPSEIEAAMYPCFTEVMVRGYDKPEDLDRLLEKSDVCILGCGIGKSDLSSEVVRYILANYDKRIVLDADGINILARDIDIIKDTKATVIMTPHVGEMARLSGMTSEEVEDDREIVASGMARELNAVVVLKGAQTVIASPHAKGTIYVNHSGNPGMATAGSGDVLAGITGALAAVIKEPHRAAACAVYIHGVAGDLAADELSMTGMTARDIIDRLPKVFKSFE